MNSKPLSFISLTRLLGWEKFSESLGSADGGIFSANKGPVYLA